MIQGKPLRAAFWTMLSSLGLVAFTAVWNPALVRARALQATTGTETAKIAVQPPTIEAPPSTARRAAVDTRGTAPQGLPSTTLPPVAAARTLKGSPLFASVVVAEQPAAGKAPGLPLAATASRADVLRTASSEAGNDQPAARPARSIAGPTFRNDRGAMPETAPGPALRLEDAWQTSEASAAPVERIVVGAPRIDAISVVSAEQRPTAEQQPQLKSANIVSEPPDASRGSDSRPLEAQLVQIQQQVDRLAEANAKQQSDALERTVQLLQQLQQTQRSMTIDNLEKQVQKLQEPAAQSQPVLPPPAPAAEKTEAQPLAKSAIPSPEAVLKAEQSSGEPETFSLQIQDAEISQVLEMLGQLAGQNILPSKDVKGKVSANLQEVTVDQALEGILRSLGYVHQHEGDFIYVMTAAEVEQRRLQGRKIVTKIYHPHYISVIDLKDLVVPLQTPAPIGKIAFTTASETGIPNDKENAGGNRLSQGDALLVQDYEEVIREVDAVVAEMDVPPLQVHIEALILSVKLEEEMKLGVNFALLHDKSNQLLVSGNGQQLKNATGFPGVASALVPPAGDFIANTAGLKYGFLSGDIAGFVEAIERITDTNVVAAPQLRVLNKQRAQLLIGKRLSYKTLAFQSNQTIESANFLDTGTRLILRPFIAPDGLIRMEVHPEKSSGSINQTTGLPDVDTTEVTTNVMVRDGSTVVIGGLIMEEGEDESSRVPVLGAVPVVGNLFRNRSTDVRRNEIVVLITPRIVTEPEDAVEGETVLAESARRAQNFRDHLSPINRHNLARMCFERAVDAHGRGELENARSWAQKALYHSPNDLEFLRLRDQIDLEIAGKGRNWLRHPFSSEDACKTDTETVPLPDAISDDEADKSDLPLPSASED